MQKCYIAGKIGDLQPEVYKKLFSDAEKEVLAMGYIPVSPLNLPHVHDKTWPDYMKEDIKAMMDCNAVYCLQNWRHSPGAKIEINLALQLGMKILHQ